jgi:hypothetical protein
LPFWLQDKLVDVLASGFLVASSQFPGSTPFNKIAFSDILIFSKVTSVHS